MENHLDESSSKVQDLVKKHFDKIERHWTPDRDSYIALGQGYAEFIWGDALNRKIHITQSSLIIWHRL